MHDRWLPIWARVQVVAWSRALDAQHPLLDFVADLRRELTRRANEASGDIKRLNLVVCDYFERVELTAQGRPVHVLPVLSWGTVESIAATSRNLSDSAAFKRAVLSRPEPITARGNEQIIPPLRAIKAVGNPRSPSETFVGALP